ncbi:MAG: NAD(P)-dependent oxidoreductase [Holophagaceae bacterium]|nr:NAD(P)-dependent oxidoreductase [Holophagaceae bacterium]
MKALVTGANGFIGSHVCRELLARGCDVYAVLRPGSGSQRLPEQTHRLHRVECDVFRAPDTELLRHCEGIEACIHCAWHVVPGEYLASPLNDDCRQGSLRLISALLAQGCGQITGVGTCFEYSLTATPLDESAPTLPLTPYASAKLSTGREGEALAQASGAAFAWARLFYLYGPWEDSRRLVPDVALRLLGGEHAAVTSGFQVRDYLHVEDVAAALVDVTLAGMRGPVNIGSGRPTRVHEIVRLLGEITGGTDLLDFGARQENAMDPPYVCADNKRLRDEADWRPRYDLRAGLEQTVSWWKGHS